MTSEVWSGCWLKHFSRHFYDIQHLLSYHGVSLAKRARDSARYILTLVKNDFVLPSISRLCSTIEKELALLNAYCILRLVLLKR